MYEVWSRTVTVVNTDPLRRCYNGCNFSEETVYGEWKLFGTYDSKAWADSIKRGFECSRYQYKIVEREVNA